MTENRFSIESALYTLALIMALGVRLLNLGAAPLSDLEASHALQALDATHNNVVSYVEGAGYVIDPQPAYTSFTALTFFLFESTNFLARFWPALLGASLALVPFFFRSLLGRKAALILAFGLALDPGMVAISRIAGGQMLALGFSLWALAFAYARKPVWSGIFTGLALLSGPAAIHGLFGLALAWGTMKVMGSYGVGTYNQEQERDVFVGISSKRTTWTWVLTSGATILFVGSLFLIYPQGLSSWITTFPTYVKGWIDPSGVPALRVLAALAIYQPLGLVFGVIGAVRGWIHRKSLEQMLSLWSVIALGLALLYPSRQVGDLVWVLLPLWSLAAVELARSLIWDSDLGIVSLGQAVLIFLVMALFWLNLSGVNVAISGMQPLTLRLAILGGVLVLAALITALVAFGWSWEISRRGLVWGLGIALGIYGLANMWSVSQLHMRGRVELWSPFPVTADADLVVKTLEDLSMWKTGRTDSIDITIAMETFSLRWTLRTFPNVDFLPERQMLAIGGEPSVVIARQVQDAPILAATYRGQDFAWWAYPGWEGVLPPDFINWLAFRSAPLQQEQVVLWARSDLFPGSFSLPEVEIPTLPEVIIPGGDAEQE